MKHTQRLSFVLLVGLLLALLSVPLPGWAQDGKPGSGQPGAQAYQIIYTRVTFNSATDQTAAVAYNSVRREYLVVWQRNLGGGNWGIFARRLSSTGGLLGSEIPVDTAGVNWAAAVAYNSNADEYLIVYTYNPISSPDYDVYARRLSGAGTVMPGYIPVDTAGPTKQSYPSVAYNSINNEYLVVYQSEKSVGGAYEIRGRRVGAGGSPMGGSFVVATGGPSRRQPDVAYNPARNQYLAVYAYDYSGTDHDIYGRRLSNSGGLLGSELIVWDVGRDDDGPALATGPDEYLVAWHECSAGTTDCDIVGRRVSGNGTLAPVAFDIAASGTQNRFWPDVAYAPGRFYLVAWHVNDSGPSAWNIRGRVVFPGQNVPAGGEFAIDDTEQSQYNPAAVCATNGGCIVAEDDNYYSPTPTEITVVCLQPRRTFVPLLRRW